MKERLLRGFLLPAGWRLLGEIYKWTIFAEHSESGSVARTPLEPALSQKISSWPDSSQSDLVDVESPMREMEVWFDDISQPENQYFVFKTLSWRDCQKLQTITEWCTALRPYFAAGFDKLLPHVEKQCWCHRFYTDAFGQFETLLSDFAHNAVPLMLSDDTVPIGGRCKRENSGGKHKGVYISEARRGGPRQGNRGEGKLPRCGRTQQPKKACRNVV